ncbi:MAG: Hsp20/alpha crystallin family protein [Planctomycetaceae bacterium]|nr:Hsp20/alpha crystallin family protein [Planctomycetaceae bacterium]
MVFQCLNPVRSNRIDREMNRLLSSFFGETPQRSSGRRSMAVNVWEKDDAWLVEAELPGVKPENLEISVIDDELAISVEPRGSEEEDATYYRRERRRGAVSRTIQLPTAVDAERVEATLVLGVLTVTLPKSETARRHRIQVHPGN